jgi:hypothetical protein
LTDTLDNEAEKFSGDVRRRKLPAFDEIGPFAGAAVVLAALLIGQVIVFGVHRSPRITLPLLGVFYAVGCTLAWRARVRTGAWSATQWLVFMAFAAAATTFLIVYAGLGCYFC